jgi:hypothetical protein
VRAFGHMHGGGREGNLQLVYTGARATHISSPRPWDLKPASMSAWPRFFIMPVGSPVCAAADRSVGAGVDPARARILLVSSLATCTPCLSSRPIRGIQGSGTCSDGTHWHTKAERNRINPLAPVYGLNETTFFTCLYRPDRGN